MAGEYIDQFVDHIDMSFDPVIANGRVKNSGKWSEISDTATDLQRFAVNLYRSLSEIRDQYQILNVLWDTQSTYMRGILQRHREEMPDTGLLPAGNGVNLIAKWILDELTK